MLSSQAVVLDTWKHLVTDLSQGDTFKTQIFHLFNDSLRRGIPAARAFIWPNPVEYPPEVAARIIQARDFGKRWLFTDDVSTDEDLTLKAKADFQAAQLDVITSIPSTELVHRWLCEARSIVHDILGSYDVEEHNRRCQFGRRAAIGLPKQSAYLYTRLACCSGTDKQFKRFKESCVADKLLRRAILETSGKNSRFVKAKSCNAVAVPKSYKAKRLIMPDSVIGGFLSNGLGKMIEVRLREKAGIDIRYAQTLHRKLAKSSSITGSLVTADMSRASDNISWPLLSRIMPYRWLREIRIDRIQYITFDKTNEFRSQTVMGMGKGYTFPLQTLVFYSLLRSIASLLCRDARIHVYGDDLIYPRWMHRYVVTLFPKVGLRLNLEKTFDSVPSTYFTGTSLAASRKFVGCFRESCGGDYLCGVDVRPYMPQGSSGTCTKTEREALLYKLLNGLISKWGVGAIRSTVRFLLVELESLQFKKGILVVPDDASPHSGLGLAALSEIKIWFDDFHFREIREVEETTIFPSGNIGRIRVTKYRGLSRTKSDKVVPLVGHLCYAWQWLAARSSDDECAVDIDCSNLYVDAPEILRRKRIKLYVTKDNVWSETPPKGVIYQTRDAEVAVVDSREECTLGWCEKTFELSSLSKHH